MDIICNYHCPMADRRKCANFILCKGIEKEGVDYNDRKNALTVICACQKQCMRTGQMENTPDAQRCYDSRIAYAKADAEDIAEPEKAESVDEPTVNTPKPKTAKAKSKAKA